MCTIISNSVVNNVAWARGIADFELVVRDCRQQHARTRTVEYSTVGRQDSYWLGK